MRLNKTPLSVAVGLLVFLQFLEPALSTEKGSIIEGQARVIDGDTIEVAGVRVRLNGVAAPELREPGGVEAKTFLEALLTTKTIRCSLSGVSSYNREVGVCWSGTTDIGAAIIASGRARDCPRYSQYRYSALEPPKSLELPLPSYCE